MLNGSIFDSAISGVIPAVGVVIGGAAVGLIRSKRKEHTDAEILSVAEQRAVLSRVGVLETLVSGTDAIVINGRIVTPASPGIVEKFDGLQGTVKSLVESVDHLTDVVVNGH